MKHIVFFLLVMIILAACGQTPTSPDATSTLYQSDSRKTIPIIQ